MCEEAVKFDTEESCGKKSAFSGVAASASAANVCFDDVQQQLLHQRSAAAAFLRKDDAYRVRVCVLLPPSLPVVRTLLTLLTSKQSRRSHKIQIQ